MPAARALSPSATLVRPMLRARRPEVLEYLSAIGQSYRVDETNADLQFTRNSLRSELLPILRAKYNPDVDGSILRLAAQAAEAQDWIADQATRLAEDCVTVKPHLQEAAIDCHRLAGQPPLLVREVGKLAWARANWPLRAMGFHEWQQLASLIERGREGESLNLPGALRARRSGDAVIIARACDVS
jgi:tRNA(Ile)-lysidine synthase